MKKASSNKALAALVLLIGACAPVSHLSAAALEISLHRAGTLLACLPVADHKFELSFIHSVSKTPVRDFYELVRTPAQGLTIKQTQETFMAHGQGLPSLVQEPDAITFERRNGQFVLTMERDIPQLIVRTDQRFKNRLHTGTTTMNLNQWPDSGLAIVPVPNCHP